MLEGGFMYTLFWFKRKIFILKKITALVDKSGNIFAKRFGPKIGKIIACVPEGGS
jgi:hypothetical protein